MGLKYFAVIGDGRDNVPHIVDLVGLVRDYGVEGRIDAVRFVGRLR